MASPPSVVNPQRDLTERNRRTARVLMAVLAALAVATLLVGIRW